MTTTRKPHAGNAGFVCELKAKLGGHVAVYDRRAGFDCDAGERWIVQHEPSGRHVAIKTEAGARQVMKGLARARSIDEAREIADVLPAGDDLAASCEPAAAPVAEDAPALEVLVDRYMAAEDPAEEAAARRALFSGQWKRGGQR